jgi:hypothetical protein
MSQMLDIIRHRLNRECDMAAHMDVDVTADMGIDMAIDMVIDIDLDVDADSLCFHGPVLNDPNIFGLLII